MTRQFKHSHIIRFLPLPLSKAFAHITLLMLFLIAGVGAKAATLTFSVTSPEPIPVSSVSSSGLDMVYVLYNTSGVKATYTPTTSEPVTWYRFSSLGGGYAEEVGKGDTITLGTEDMGYIVEEGAKRSYFWIVNYNNHRLSMEYLEISPEQDCDMANLIFHGNASAIHYYTINGQQRILPRELKIKYQTLVYDEDFQNYYPVDKEDVLDYIDTSIHIIAPLCNTYFDLTGDAFLMKWNMPQNAQTDLYTARAVEATTWAVQDIREVDNEKKAQNTEGLGGSAPVNVTFTAVSTDAAVFTEWQFSKYSDFADIIDRYTTEEFTFVFNDTGTFYVRFVCADSSGECEFIGDTYSVSIGDSALDCPNAFSPGGSPGINDEWKVSYRSIISFECHIFNRYGVEMCSFNDPSIGWDGKYKGKVVPSGVYYYVIKAVGSDGKKYDKTGDINIVNFKQGNPNGTNQGVTE